MKAPLFLFLFLCSILSVEASTQGFLPGTEDVPLMPELIVVPETDMIFDHPEGRVVTVSATGSSTLEQLQQFYDVTLSQLGWQKESKKKSKFKLMYKREGEVLQLESEPGTAEGTLQVTFQLKPLSE